MTQLDLLAWRAPAHAKGSDTEHAAARRADSYVANDRDAVLKVLKQWGPQSAEAVTAILSWKDVYRARRRLSDLKNAGLIEDTGLRETTSHGRGQIVWAAKP